MTMLMEPHEKRVAFKLQYALDNYENYIRFRISTRRRITVLKKIGKHRIHT